MQGLTIIGMGNANAFLEHLMRQNLLHPENPDKNTSAGENPLLADIDQAISDMKHARDELEVKIKMTEHLRDALARVFKDLENADRQENKSEKPETAAPPEKPKAPAEPGKAKSPETSPEKIDAEPSNGPVNPQLKHLKKGVNKAIKSVRGTKLAQHFKDVRRLSRRLSAAVKPGLELTDMELIARIEAAIGEALDFLQTSKLALRTKVLKEVKQILEETIDTRNK